MNFKPKVHFGKSMGNYFCPAEKKPIRIERESESYKRVVSDFAAVNDS
jgi:hypothetical protein